MTYINKIIQLLLGKPYFILSKEIPFSYILNKGIEYTCGILRGYFRRIHLKKVGSRLYVGKNVVFKNKKKIVFGENVRIESNTIIDALSTNGVALGSQVKIGANSTILCTGSLSDIGYGLIIGKDSNFSENTFFGAAGGIEIGENVISGQNVRFHSENHLYHDLTQLIRSQGVTREGIKIGDNCWIGSGVVFLDGSVVSDGCVIGANSVVKGKFGPNSVIVGTPARIIKNR